MAPQYVKLFEYRKRSHYSIALHSECIKEILGLFDTWHFKLKKINLRYIDFAAVGKCL